MRRKVTVVVLRVCECLSVTTKSATYLIYMPNARYHIAPNFRGTIFSWILWLAFWSRKFNFGTIVGVVTLCARLQRAQRKLSEMKCRIAAKDVSDYVRLLSENEREQKLPTKSARTSVQTTSFFWHRISKQTQVAEQTAEGAKGRKKGQIDLCTWKPLTHDWDCHLVFLFTHAL